MNAQHMSMSQRWNRIRTVPGLKRDVIAMVAVMVVGLATSVYLLSQVNVTFPWVERYVIKAEVDDAIAVRPAAQQEVRISGVRVGLISANEPTDHNTTILTMSLEPGYQVFDNAKIVYRPVNPLNQMFVTINPGGPPGKVVPSGYQFPMTQTSRPIQAEEVFDKLDEKSRAALTSLLAESDDALAHAPETLPQALKVADSSLATLRPVVDRLAKRHDNIEKLVSGFSQLTNALGRNDTRLTSLVDSTQATLDALAGRNNELGRTLQELPGTTDELRRALASTSTLTHELNPVLDNVKAASRDLPEALAELRDASGPLEKTADTARPVLDKARGLVKDLRDSVKPLRSSFDDLAPITACADEYTAKIAPWLYDGAAFFYNSNSAFNFRDINGTAWRGMLTFHANSPLGSMHPSPQGGEALTNKYQDAPSVTTGLPYPRRGGGECR